MEEKAKTELLTAYASSTGLICRRINGENENLEIVPAGQEEDLSCHFCVHVLRDRLGVSLPCNAVHNYGAAQARRFGGSYVYFCPGGLTHIACVLGGKEKGALVAGPALMVEREDFFQELCEKYKPSKAVAERLRECIWQIKSYSPEQIRHFANLLEAVAFRCSDQGGEADRLYTQTQQQSRIGEFIQSLKSEDQPEQYPVGKEKELQSALAAGNSARAKALLNEILGHILLSAGGDLTAVKARVTELAVLLSRAALEGGADEQDVFELNNTLLAKLAEARTMESLCDGLARALNSFSNYVFEFPALKHADVIHQAVDYMRRHCGEKLSLEIVAQEVYLSASYFSKIFKSELGSSFISYLNMLRIEQSKKLLKIGCLSIAEIATSVGFEDQSYYSKVFRKHTGVTPLEYRKSRGIHCP